MYHAASVLGNEPSSLIAFDDVVLENLRHTRVALQNESEPSVVITARCDLLKEELQELYASLLKHR